VKLSQLLAAGRRHSASDLKMLQQMHDHAVAFGASCGTKESHQEPAFHTDAAFLTEIGMSHGDLANLLRMALRAEYPGKDTYVWTQDVYDDAVVYEVSTNGQDALYQRSYSILDGKVTFGDPVKVIMVRNYVPVTESGDPADPTEAEREELTGDLVPLVEKAVKKDGTIALRIIAPGQGSSGYYGADVLKRDGPNVFKAGLHMYADHPTISEESDRPERSIKDLVGTLTSDARWEEQGSAGPGLYAEAKLRADVAPLIEDLAPHIGVSIRALGKAGTGEVDGKKTRVIESIDQAKSVDFVTVPGAGGRVLDLIESARGQRPTTPEEGGEVSQQELDEARRKIAELEQRETERQQRETEMQQREAERDRELSRLREANLMRGAHAIVVETLAKISLPAPTRDRLTAQLTANPPLKEGTNDQIDREVLVARVNEAATAELDYLTKAVGSPGGVRGMGGEAPVAPTAPDLEESEKRITAALADL
jgi:hypothetical protein